jgi:DNA repair exonuclease SbcCD ATPase subunit
MKPSSYSPTSQLSDYSDSQPSSRHLATDNLSVILNIDKTVAKSRQIIQESLQVSRKNNERRQQLEERLKSIVSLNESSRESAVSRGLEERGGTYSSDREDSRSIQPSLRHQYEEEDSAKQHAEAQVSELRKKLLRYERIEAEYDKIREELEENREELRREQTKARDIVNISSAKNKRLMEGMEDLEATVRRLKLDLEQSKEENGQLERAIKTADNQRAELLKECELLRQTLSDLKKLHLRELEDMEKRLDEAIRDKAIAERGLSEALDTRKVAIRSQQDGLQTQVQLLEAKLRDLEGKYTQQMRVNEDLQGQVQALYPISKPEDKLVADFEAQMQGNNRRIEAIQQRLDRPRSRHYVSDSDSELSNEELTAMIRREQEELGLTNVLRPKNSAKKADAKGKERERVGVKAPRRKPAKPAEKRSLSRCKYCQD